ncbi:hypothetical protein CWI39_1036p0020 [Hamiltosporidium magnivora]|uniref:Uncharacterized protein n=1 Tax=Hamiltosporidium magnivora TaxID=148818 RepID=A0A4Q9L8K2_9MICR|nr:hypothetical protein CWI39_1036p0020 [Hamiltosporidium magnivora]
MMIALPGIYFDKTNNINLNRSADQIFYITELYLSNINDRIDFLKLSEKNKYFDFKATNKDILDSEYPINSLKFLFQNYDPSSIKQLSISDFSIDNLNVKAFSNLLDLKEINIYKINFQNICFSELFCASREYKIKRMELNEINISEQDLIFIENLKKIKDIIFWWCDIHEMTFFKIKFLFLNEFYIELKYNREEDDPPNKTIKFITEKFKKKYIVVKKI